MGIMKKWIKKIGNTGKTGKTPENPKKPVPITLFRQKT
jgi:hypothetical protein